MSWNSALKGSWKSWNLIHEISGIDSEPACLTELPDCSILAWFTSVHQLSLSSGSPIQSSRTGQHLSHGLHACFSCRALEGQLWRAVGDVICTFKCFDTGVREQLRNKQPARKRRVLTLHITATGVAIQVDGQGCGCSVRSAPTPLPPSGDEVQHHQAARRVADQGNLGDNCQQREEDQQDVPGR